MNQLLRRLVVFSDMHFMAWKDTNAPVEWVEQLERCLQDAQSLQPDLVMFNGDLTNGKERDYELAFKIIGNTLNKSTLFTMGNHEYYGYYEDPDFSFDSAQERFIRHTRQDSIYFAVQDDVYRLICLSPERYLPNEFGDAAWLSDVQLEWLSKNLLTQVETPTLVFLHQPVDGTVTDANAYCVQSEKIRSILRQHPGTIFVSGHTHCRMDRPDQIALQDGTLFVGGGCACNSSPQSRWFDFYKDYIVIRLRDHQRMCWLDDYEYIVNWSNSSETICVSQAGTPLFP